MQGVVFNYCVLKIAKNKKLVYFYAVYSFTAIFFWEGEECLRLRRLGVRVVGTTRERTKKIDQVVSKEEKKKSGNSQPIGPK